MNSFSPGDWDLQCNLHDWEGLRTEVRFVFDNPIPNGEANGRFRRTGEYSGWLVRRGSATMKCDGESVTARPGQWLFCFGEHIEQRLSLDVHLLSVRMAAHWTNGERLFAGPMILCEANQHPQFERIALELIKDLGKVEMRQEPPAHTFLWRTRFNFSSYLRQREHVYEWTDAVASLLRQHGGGIGLPRGIDSRLAAALHQLDTLPYDQPFPGQSLCRTAGLTIGQLNRMCVAANNQTLHVYWDHRRVERAQRLLLEGNLGVKQIAYTLGFGQLSHFSTWFKRRTGKSPRAFRTTKRE